MLRVTGLLLVLAGAGPAAGCNNPGTLGPAVAAKLLAAFSSLPPALLRFPHVDDKPTAAGDVALVMILMFIGVFPVPLGRHQDHHFRGRGVNLASIIRGKRVVINLRQILGEIVERAQVISGHLFVFSIGSGIL